MQLHTFVTVWKAQKYPTYGIWLDDLETVPTLGFRINPSYENAYH
jgi:hypothetical protein